MTEKNEATVNNNGATENNYQPRELKLEPKELMRISLFDVDENITEMSISADEKFGLNNARIALMQAMEDWFGMTCVPSGLLCKILGTAFDKFGNLENILATLNADNSCESCKGENAESEGEDNKE